MVDLLDQLRILKASIAEADGRAPDLFTSSEVGVCLIGADGRFERLNSTWKDCLGHSIEGMLGRALLDFVHPDDRGATKAAAARLESEDAIQFWHRFRQSDGHYRMLYWVAARADTTGAICAVVRAAEGGVMAAATGESPVVEGILDVAGLDASPTELYRRVVETSPDAIIVTDLSGTVLVCNLEAATQQGLENPEELVGLNAFDYVAPEDREKAFENARRTLETGMIRDVEYTIVRRNGTRVAVQLSASLIRGSQGEPRAFIGIMRDVSRRKQAREALRESQERFRILYQDNPSMYFTVDACEKVLSVNQFGAKQLGYEVEELLGKPVLGVFFEEDKAAVSEQLASCVQHPGKVHHWEFRKVRKDGRVIWVREAARATKDANGETIVLIVCEDVTERKRMEEELQQAREALENKVERQMVRGRLYGLTFREMTVLNLVSTGSSDKEIGEKLGISPLTVNKHVANVLAKMGAATRSEASARAVRESIVE